MPDGSQASPVCVVTGASRGLGAAVARQAAVRGDDLVLVARDVALLEQTADACRASGSAVLVVQADLLDPDAARTVLDRTLDRFGRVDALVNNAGAYRTSPSRAGDEAVWSELLALNLTVPFRMATTFGSHMVDAGYGSIVNVASVFALVGVPATAAYAASKGGLVALSRTLAVEWARHGVRVNVVAAGHMLTDMTADELATEAAQRYVTRNVPLGRVAQPDEVASLVCYLAGRDSSFVTGSVHVADGGFSAR